MRGNTAHGRSLQTKNKQVDTAPFDQPLSQREVRKRFLLDVLQEKGVLFPFAICAAGLIYNLLYASVLGRSKMILMVAVAAGFFGAASLLWRLVIRYQQGYTQKMQELAAHYDAEQTLSIETRLQETFTSLKQGFNEIKAEEGLKILHGLDHEYRQLQPVLRRGEEADLLSISNLAVLVRETYLQGLNVLEHALELERAAGSTDPSQLQADQSLAGITALMLADGGRASLNPPEWIRRLQPQVILVSVAPSDGLGRPDPELLASYMDSISSALTATAGSI